MRSSPAQAFASLTIAGVDEPIAIAGGATGPATLSRTMTKAEVIQGERIVLMPLRIEDAEEMVAALGDESLHRFTGGRPATAVELRERYAKLVRGSPDKTHTWLNWIIRMVDAGGAVGTMQATLIGEAADIAWVVGVRWQSRGFATEAARCVASWLVSKGVRTLRANIHPGHEASERVASRAGLTVTEGWVDGERVWARTNCRAAQ